MFYDLLQSPSYLVVYDFLIADDFLITIVRLELCDIVIMLDLIPYAVT